MRAESLQDLLRRHRYMECRSGALGLLKRGGLGPVYWNNLAYRFHLQGRHRDAIDTATWVARLRGAAPARKARAFLILHQTARSIGYARVALGLGVVAKIQATVARRPDMEEEISRSLCQMQHPEALPPLDELIQELSHFSQDWTTGECRTSVE